MEMGDREWHELLNDLDAMERAVHVAVERLTKLTGYSSVSEQINQQSLCDVIVFRSFMHRQQSVSLTDAGSFAICYRLGRETDEYYRELEQTFLEPKLQSLLWN